MGKASRKKREFTTGNKAARQPMAPKTAEKPAALPHKKGFINNPWVHCLAIVLLGIIVYSNTFQVPFILDDWLIIKNPYVTDLKNLAGPKDTEFLNQKFIAFLSRPVAFLTFAMNFAMHNFEFAGYHIFNLVTHLGTSLLVYYFFLLTLQTENLLHSPLHRQRRIIALFAGMLFAAHPIQTQSVTYIAQRFTSLASFFYLAAIIMYIRFRSALRPDESAFAGQSVLWYAGSICFAILAYKTKEIAYTLPFAIALYEYFFFPARKSRALLLVPIFLTLLVFPITLLLIKSYSIPASSASVGSAGELYAGLRALGENKDMSRLNYLFTEFPVLTTYLGLILLPINQTVIREAHLYSSLFQPQVFLSFLLLTSLIITAALMFRSYHKNPNRNYLLPISFGILWFFLTLSVESSIIPLYPIYEHRLYLPIVGIFMALLSPLAFIIERAENRNPAALKIFTVLMLVIIFAYGSATYLRNNIWKDSRLFWADVKQKSSSSRANLVLFNVAMSLGREGKNAEAIEVFQEILKIDPRNSDVYNAIGATYLRMKKIDDAIKYFRHALSINPDIPEARLGLGNAYLEKGVVPLAITELKMAEKDFSSFYDYYRLLGYAYLQSGRVDEAIKEIRKAVQLNPQEPVVHFNLGLAYMVKKDYSNAIREYQEAIRLKPDYIEAHNNLGMVHGILKDFDRAIQAFKSALAIRPDHPEARRNMEIAVKQKETAANLLKK